LRQRQPLGFEAVDDAIAFAPLTDQRPRLQMLSWHDTAGPELETIATPAFQPASALDRVRGAVRIARQRTLADRRFGGVGALQTELNRGGSTCADAITKFGVSGSESASLSVAACCA
jgi:hypothetical protein